MLFNAITLQAQTRITVDNTPGSGAMFSDLQAAINSASDGDVILVQQSVTQYTNPNTGSGDIEIDKDLTIIGAGYKDGQFYKTSVSGFMLMDGSSGTTLRGMEFRFLQTDNGITSDLTNIRVSECKAAGLSFNGNQNSGSPVLVRNVVIEGNELDNISAANLVQNINIRNNIIDSGSLGLSLNGNATIVRNNIILTGGTTLLNQFNPPVTFFHCVFVLRSGNTFIINGSYSLNNCFLYNFNDFTQTVTINNGASNGAQVQNTSNCIFSGDPMFATQYSNTLSVFDFTPLAGSPLIGVGANGGDIGFQSNFEFKYLGNPKNYPEVKVTNFTGATQPNGTLTFEIQATAH